MYKTFTFVKMQPGFSRDEFFERWCQHTRSLGREIRPEIESSRLMLVDGDGPFVGIAETHWSDAEALDRTMSRFKTPSGQILWKDLETFVDPANSPTFVVTHEAAVSSTGEVEVLEKPGPAAAD
jgi:hypothetical protein